MAGNGRIVARGGEPFPSKGNATRALNHFILRVRGSRQTTRRVDGDGKPQAHNP